MLSALQRRNGSAEQRTERDRNQNLLRVRRENQNEPFAFHQRRKTRNTKRHHEQTDDLPGFKFHFVFAGGGGADEQREADDEAQTQRGQPQARTGIEVAHQHDEIPDEITPKYQPALGKVGEVADRIHVVIRGMIGSRQRQSVHHLWQRSVRDTNRYRQD